MEKIIDFTNDIDEKMLEKVAKCIINGGIVVFPTETVYGIGANAKDEKAVEKIFKAKKRPSDNPLIVHVCDFDMIYSIIRKQKITDIEKKIMKKFMPGPLTLILPREGCIPDNVTGGLDTVGIRMPENLVAMKLIKKAGVPIAAPSANVSGKPSGTNVKDIQDELINSVDYIIDGGDTKIGLESTVIKVENDVINILRPGKITKEDLESLGYKVKIDEHVFKNPNNNEIVMSPGMKHRHYAPTTKTILVEGEDFTKKADKIISFAKKNQNMNVGVIGISENSIKYENIANICFIDAGSINDLDEISKNIFSNLRKIDSLNLDVCYIEGVKRQGVGIAIENRVIRACEYNVVEV